MPNSDNQSDKLLERIDDVLKENRKEQYVLIGCTIALFLCGIACIVSALLTGEYLWSAPSAVTTYLLRWPIEKIQNIRRDNIALATAPAIINLLPRAQAAEQLQKLIQKLYGESENGE